MLTGRLPKPDGRLSETVRRAVRIYGRLYGVPLSSAAFRRMSTPQVRRRRRLAALLNLELEAMTRRELANYYAAIAELRRV
jgi:hypothetical protein